MFGYSRISLTLLLVALQQSVVCTAQEITKEDIVRIYERKLAQIDGCRVSYDKSTAFMRQGETFQRNSERQIRILHGGRSRSESSGLNSKGVLVPTGIQTDDGEERRELSFTNDGFPDVGVLRRSSEPMVRMADFIFTPFGMSGLLSFKAFGMHHPDGTAHRVDWFDLVSIVQSPQTTVHPDIRPAPNGEPAVLVEYAGAGRVGARYRAWLSVERNLALLQCDALDYHDGQESVATRAECSDFAEVSDGLFLPRTTKYQLLGEYAGGPPPSVQVCSNIEYEFGLELADDVFRAAFPEGVRVDDEIAGIQYVVGETASLKSQLDANAGDIRTAVEKTHEMGRLADPSAALIERPIPPKRIARNIIYGMGGIVIATVVMLPLGLWLGRLSATRRLERSSREDGRA